MAAVQNRRNAGASASSQANHLGINMSKVSIIVRIQLSADSAAPYAEAARAVVAATRQEDGCEWYGIATDVTDLCVVWISEQWTSKGASGCALEDAPCGGFFRGLCRA